MKIITIGSNTYANWIDKAELVDTVEEADLVLFTGGADVDPVLYKHERNYKSSICRIRDVKDVANYDLALKLGKPMMGICRGSQFLTAMQPKGYLIQHCDNHGIGGTHGIKFNDKEVMEITSTHHQMMYPYDVENHELIAWASPTRASIYELANGEKTRVDKEPEVVYYPDTNCLAIQGHPEMMHGDYPIHKKLNELIITKLFKND